MTQKLKNLVRNRKYDLELKMHVIMFLISNKRINMIDKNTIETLRSQARLLRLFHIYVYMFEV